MHILLGGAQKPEVPKPSLLLPLRSSDSAVCRAALLSVEKRLSEPRWSSPRMQTDRRTQRNMRCVF